MRTSGHLALVTGGGSGIGLALARRLTRAGNTVIIGGRDPERLAAALRQLPGGHAVPVDIADVARLPEVLDGIRERFGPLSLLVNNAGALSPYPFENPDAGAGISEEVLTNVLGTIQLTRLALPQLREHPSAAVVTLSSVLSYVAVPRLPVYAATKAALHSFSRSLRAGLVDSPVKVFDVLPPLVDTEMARRLPGAKLSPETVAEAVLAGLAADRYEIKVGQAGAVARLSRLSPGLADRVVARRTRPPATSTGMGTRASAG
jgi:uncharacterized oxidoreductase